MMTENPKDLSTSEAFREWSILIDQLDAFVIKNQVGWLQEWFYAQNHEKEDSYEVFYKSGSLINKTDVCLLPAVSLASAQAVIREISRAFKLGCQK